MRELMRIGITGTHGAGKTTLARKLADTLNLPLIEEVASEYTPEERRTLKVQFEILERQKQLEDQHREEGFVSDRTLFCNYAYLQDVLSRTPYYDLDNKTMRRFHTLEHELKTWQNRYTDIFYLPPITKPANKTDHGWQLIIASKVTCLLHYYAPTFKTTHTKTIEERCDDVLKWLTADVDECMWGEVQ